MSEPKKTVPDAPVASVTIPASDDPMSTVITSPPQNERLRTCVLNGRQYLVPDRAIKGSEMIALLLELAGKEALDGELLLMVRGQGFSNHLQRVTSSSMIGGTFATPGSLQPASPLTFFTIVDPGADR